MYHLSLNFAMGLNEEHIREQALQVVYTYTSDNATYKSVFHTAYTA